MVIELKTSVFYTFCVYLLKVGWGLDGGWMPLTTLPHGYCDPESLVEMELRNSRVVEFKEFTPYQKMPVRVIDKIQEKNG